jgi:hypothetical protein
MMSELIDNKNDLSPSEQMMLSVLVSDRAYERPRQQLTTLGRALDGDAPRVTVYIPDNNRNKVIDVESIPSRDLFKESE